jgi:hypothetical protein
MGWPKGKRCPESVAAYDEANRNLKLHSDRHDKNDLNVDLDNGGSHEVLLVLPRHLVPRPYPSLEGPGLLGDVLPLLKRIRANTSGKTLQIQSIDMKAALDAISDTKTALRKIPSRHVVCGTSQILLRPHHTDSYVIQDANTSSRPRAVTSASDHDGSMTGGHDDTKFAKELFLSLGVAAKSMPGTSSMIQMRVFFGHFELHAAAQGKLYSHHSLEQLFKRLSARGVASFSTEWVHINRSICICCILDAKPGSSSECKVTRLSLP